MKRLLCVWLPNWPIQRLRSRSLGDAAAPEPIDEQALTAATILWHEDPRRGRLVTACCHRAAALGVRVAMPIAQAGEMTRDPQQPPRIERHDPWLDRETLNQIASVFQQHISPLVAIEMLDDQPWADHPRHQPESLLCDITGIAPLFGDEAGLLRSAERLLAQRDLTGRMAIADSVAAAWALAHHGSRQTIKDGGWIAPSGSGVASVRTLPVTSLRISPQTVLTLRRLGIERVDQLLGLPRDGLATRLGRPLVRRIEQLTGEVDEPLTVHRPMADDSYAWELEYPTDDQKILADRIERLMEKVRAGLAARNRGALRLTCRLDLAVHPPLTLDVGLFAPTLDVGHLTGLMINQMENRRLPSAVVRLTLVVTLTDPLRSSQASLFGKDGRDGEAWMSGSAVSRLVDSLSGRLGRDAVLGVTLNQDPLPEKAYDVWPLTGNDSAAGKATLTRLVSSPRKNVAPVNSRPRSGRIRTRHDPSPEDAMRRPLSLLVRPVALIVDANASACEPDRRLPDRFRLDGIVHRVVRYWGPERIETGWWKGPSVRRDYYRIETDRGLWWWIFRNLADPRASDTKTSCGWMLHGRFT